jgi:hypothetical protein
MPVQSVVFMAPEWSESRARAWLKKNQYHPIKPVHYLGHEMRYRMLEPIFKRYTTKVLPNGVHLVIGYEKK